MGLRDLLQDGENTLGSAAQGVGNFVNNDIIHPIQQDFQPPIQQPIPQQQSMVQAPPIQNFINWMGNQVNNIKNTISPPDNYHPNYQNAKYAPQVDTGSAQPALPAVQNYINNGGFHFADNIQTGNPATDWMARTAAGIPQSVANSPLQLAQGVGQSAQDISSGQIMHPNVALSDVANLAMPIATIATLKGAPGAIQDIAQVPSFLGKVGEGMVQGAKIGGLFGAGSGLASGRDITDPTSYLQNLAVNTAQGIGAGAFLGGATGGVSHVIGKVGDAYQGTTNRRAGQQFVDDVKTNEPYVQQTPTIKANILPFMDMEPDVANVTARAANIIQSGDIGNEPAANILNNVMHNTSPMFDNFNTVDKAKIADDLLSIRNGVIPNPVHPALQPAVDDLYRTAGMRAMQSGKINFGARIGGKEPTEPQPTEESPIKEQLTQPPLPPKMSQDAIGRGIDTPIKGSDISVSPKAQIRYKIANPEPLPWENGQDSTSAWLNQGNPPANPAVNPYEGARESLPKDETNTVPNRNGNPIISNKSREMNPIKIKMNDFANPLMNQPKDLQDALHNYDAELKTAQVDANQTNAGYKDIVKEIGLTPKEEEALVHYSQNPKTSTITNLQSRGYPIDQDLVDRAKPLLDHVKEVEADRLVRANEAGVETATRKNHIYQAYSQTPEEIKQIIEGKGLNKKPGFTMQKAFPTFLEAQDKAGLLPKYTTHGQLSALAEDQLGKAVAGKKLQNFLEQAGYIKAGADAPHEYVPIASPNFPRASDGSVFMAQPKVAEVLNNVFGGVPQSPIQKGLKVVGKASAKAQATLLTTPGYTVHGFSISQAGKDITAGIGRVVSGHPIQGIKMAATPIQAMARGIFGSAGDFEKANADSIRQMANEGIGYTGKFDYKTDQPNTAVPGKITIGGAYNKVEQATVGTPTFQKFMFQRRVQLFSQFRDALVSAGLPLQDAVHGAAQQLKNYDGIVNDLGRSPDVKNFMKAFFFAPQYRESVMGSLINTLKGTADFKNADYQYSRSLLLGMGVTYLAYNALNMKTTGHPIWQNQQGKEFSVMFPYKQDGQLKFNSIDWMPGITTIPRSIVGTITSLARGDTNTAIQQAGGFFSSPIQTVTQALSNKGHFGNTLFDPSKPLLPQQAGYVASNLLLPGGVNTVAKYFQQQSQGKNPSLPMAAANLLQLPVKEGTDSTYFNNKNIAMGSLDQNQQNVFNELYSREHDSNGLPIPLDNETKRANAILRRDNPAILAAETQAAVKTAQQTGQPLNPLYTYTPEQQKVILEYEGQLVGSPERKEALAANNSLPASDPNKGVLADYFTKAAQYSTQLQASGVKFPQSNNPVPPTASPYVQQQLNAKNYADPQVKAFLTADTAYKNQVRGQAGAPLLNSFGQLPLAAAASAASYQKQQNATLGRKIKSIQKENSYLLKKSLGKIKGEPQVRISHSPKPSSHGMKIAKATTQGGYKVVAPPTIKSAGFKTAFKVPPPMHFS